MAYTGRSRKKSRTGAAKKVKVALIQVSAKTFKSLFGKKTARKTRRTKKRW